jgi:hypothetical protein
MKKLLFNSFNIVQLKEYGDKHNLTMSCTKKVPQERKNSRLSKKKLLQKS